MNRLGIEGALKLLPTICEKTRLLDLRFRIDEDAFILSYSGQAIKCQLPSMCFHSLESMLIKEKVKETDPNGEGHFIISLTTLYFQIGLESRGVSFSNWQSVDGIGRFYFRCDGISRTNVPNALNLHWFLLMAMSQVNVDKTNKMCNEYGLTPENMFVLKNGDIICRVGGSLVFGFSPHYFSREFNIMERNHIRHNTLCVQTSIYDERLSNITTTDNMNFLIREMVVYDDGIISIPMFLKCTNSCQPLNDEDIKFGKLVGESLKKMLTMQKK